MRREIAALILLGAALVLPQHAGAQSVMCAEPDFAAALERAERDAAAPLPLGDEDLPWCANADDPRCAPLDAGSTPLSLGLRHPLAVDAEQPDGACIPSADRIFAPHVGLVPRAGISSRLERPPR